MIRLIIRTDDAGMACNVGGAVFTEFRTFDLDLPEVEKLLRPTGTYAQAQVVGVEVVMIATASPSTGSDRATDEPNPPPTDVVGDR